MKKFLKNAILIMLVSSFVLNIVNLVYQYVVHTRTILEISEVVQQINNGEIVIDNTYEHIYQNFASAYFAGVGNNLSIQVGIIILSIVLGITIGMIVTFEEKSKIRIVIIYILGLFLTVLAPTMSETIYYMSFNTFFDDMIYYLDSIWKWYTLVFFIIYTIKIYINNKKAKELNKILKNKQKDNL